jgi:hypothetical protein
LDGGRAVIEVSLLSSAKTYLTVGALNPIATIKANIDNAFEENKIRLRELEGLELCSEQIPIFGEEVFKQNGVHGARLNSFLQSLKEICTSFFTTFSANHQDALTILAQLFRKTKGGPGKWAP